MELQLINDDKLNSHQLYWDFHKEGQVLPLCTNNRNVSKSY